LFGEAYYKLSDKLTATVGLRYFNATQNFQQTLGGVVFDLVDGITDQEISARVAYQTPKYKLALYAKNLTNEAANYGDLLSLAATPPSRLRYATNRPTSVGLSFRVYF